MRTARSLLHAVSAVPRRRRERENLHAPTGAVRVEVRADGIKQAQRELRAHRARHLSNPRASPLIAETGPKREVGCARLACACVE